MATAKSLGSAAFDVVYNRSIANPPLLRSSTPAAQEETGQLFSLSVFAAEFPEWQGPLPLGSPTENFTMLIAGG